MGLELGRVTSSSDPPTWIVGELSGSATSPLPDRAHPPEELVFSPPQPRSELVDVRAAPPARSGPHTRGHLTPATGGSRIFTSHDPTAPARHIPCLSGVRCRGGPSLQLPAWSRT